MLALLCKGLSTYLDIQVPFHSNLDSVLLADTQSASFTHATTCSQPLFFTLRIPWSRFPLLLSPTLPLVLSHYFSLFASPGVVSRCFPSNPSDKPSATSRPSAESQRYADCASRPMISQDRQDMPALRTEVEAVSRYSTLLYAKT